MTNEEILTKAIEKAVEGGYTLPPLFTVPMDDDTKIDQCKIWIRKGDYYYIIFSRSFAKSFWGEAEAYDCNPITPGIMKTIHKPNCAFSEKLGWQYHLQQMVLEENPLDYLKKFI